MTSPEKLDWPKFAAEVAATANVRVEDISPTTRLLEDLELDSLGLAEVVAFLLVDLEMPTLSDGLAARDWRSTLVGDIYTEYQSEQLPAAPIETRMPAPRKR